MIHLFNPTMSAMYPMIVRADGSVDGVTLAPRGRLLLPQGATVDPTVYERYPALVIQRMPGTVDDTAPPSAVAPTDEQTSPTPTDDMEGLTYGR